MEEARTHLARGDAVDRRAADLIDEETAAELAAPARALKRRRRVRQGVGLAFASVLVVGSALCSLPPARGGATATAEGSAGSVQQPRMTEAHARQLVARWERLQEVYPFRSAVIQNELPSVLGITENRLPEDPVLADQVRFEAARMLRHSRPDPAVLSRLSDLLQAANGTVARAAAISITKVQPAWQDDPALRETVEAALRADPSIQEHQ